MKISSNGSSQQEISWLLKEKYNNIQTEEFFEDVNRLAKGEHIDYIIGFVEFLGCKIDLSQKPLIPRTETEYWVEQAIEDMKSRLRKRNSEIEPPTPRSARGRAPTPQSQNSLPASLSQYDYILANPPYVSEGAEVQQSVLDNEPLNAVFAGKDGLDYIKRFLREAKNHLKKHGVIYMEFDPEQKEAIAYIVKKEKYTAHEFFRDQYEKWRYVRIV